uniref:Uncharacterized protein n=1 Tax=uncultured bacterium A1Q1_fos_1870 TaxID=1256554 RepID=L7VZQ0_9BACT|nr:hypothetical protein [uncultured bacterium A1Q1_fos_1870]
MLAAHVALVEALRIPEHIRDETAAVGERREYPRDLTHRQRWPTEGEVAISGPIEDVEREAIAVRVGPVRSADGGRRQPDLGGDIYLGAQEQARDPHPVLRPALGDVDVGAIVRVQLEQRRIPTRLVEIAQAAEALGQDVTPVGAVDVDHLRGIRGVVGGEGEVDAHGAERRRHRAVGVAALALVVGALRVVVQVAIEPAVVVEARQRKARPLKVRVVDERDLPRLAARRGADLGGELEGLLVAGGDGTGVPLEQRVPLAGAVDLGVARAVLPARVAGDRGGRQKALAGGGPIGRLVGRRARRPACVFHPLELRGLEGLRADQRAVAVAGDGEAAEVVEAPRAAVRVGILIVDGDGDRHRVVGHAAELVELGLDAPGHVDGELEHAFEAVELLFGLVERRGCGGIVEGLATGRQP